MGYYTPYTTDAFTVRYTHKFRFLVGSHLPWLLIFLALTIAPFHPIFDAKFVSEPAHTRFVIAAPFAGFFVLVLIETLLAAVKLAVSRTALIVTSEGITGFHTYLGRHFSWHEIQDIYKMPNTLHIVRKPRTALGRFFYAHTHQGSRFRWEVRIAIPLKSIDTPEEDIHIAIAHHAPKGFYDGLESSMRGRHWAHFELKRS